MSSENSKMIDSAIFENIINDTISNEEENLKLISEKIWNKPELKFEEHFAHNLLADYLQLKGFVVTRNCILPTAFRAEYENIQNGVKCTTGIIMCEYDALPQIGHACGHNLIAEVGGACAIAVKNVMEKSKIFGKVIVLGTPAEEAGGGKIHLLKAGSFDNADFALMAHPSATNTSGPGLSATLEINVSFEGKESHAGLCPWDGINALDASVACYNNVSLLRQQILPEARINVAIRDCGHATNVIPKLSKMQFMIRTFMTGDMNKLKDRVEKCIEGAATATGCQYKIETNEYEFYKHMIQNEVIENRYRYHARRLGLTPDFTPNIKKGPSSDCGNVSHFLPTIHPVFHIGSDSRPHTEEFCVAAGSKLAQRYVLNTSKILALTFLDVLANPTLLELAKVEFSNTEKN